MSRFLNSQHQARSDLNGKLLGTDCSKNI